jgi:predicted nucleic acid-binding protein
MLCDTGPLIALIDARQPEHVLCRRVFDAAPVPLTTTWTCFVEAMYLLRARGGPRYQNRLWAMTARKVLVLHHHADTEMTRMQLFMERYDNMLMDLAHASLMVAAEVTNDRKVFTLDKNFRIYRFEDGSYFEVAP